jgi:hypothetical protein
MYKKPPYKRDKEHSPSLNAGLLFSLKKIPKDLTQSLSTLKITTEIPLTDTSPTSALTTSESLTDQPVPWLISPAYSFSIKLSNAGKETLSEQKVLTLESSEQVMSSAKDSTELNEETLLEIEKYINAPSNFIDIKSIVCTSMLIDPEPFLSNAYLGTQVILANKTDTASLQPLKGLFAFLLYKDRHEFDVQYLILFATKFFATGTSEGVEHGERESRHQSIDLFVKKLILKEAKSQAFNIDLQGFSDPYLGRKKAAPYGGECFFYNGVLKWYNFKSGGYSAGSLCDNKHLQTIEQLQQLCLLPPELYTTNTYDDELKNYPFKDDRQSKEGREENLKSAISYGLK